MPSCKELDERGDGGGGGERGDGRAAAATALSHPSSSAAQRCASHPAYSATRTSGEKNRNFRENTSGLEHGVQRDDGGGCTSSPIKFFLGEEIIFGSPYFPTHRKNVKRGEFDKCRQQSKCVIRDCKTRSPMKWDIYVEKSKRGTRLDFTLFSRKIRTLSTRFFLRQFGRTFFAHALLQRFHPIFEINLKKGALHICLRGLVILYPPSAPHVRREFSE